MIRPKILNKHHDTLTLLVRIILGAIELCFTIMNA